MKVLRLRPDYDYLSFYTWNPEEYSGKELHSSRLLGIGGSRRAASWEPLNLYPEEVGRERGDFAYLLSCNFAVGEHALGILRPILEGACEFLPLAPYKGETYHLLNVLDVTDCLSHETTTWISPRVDPSKPEATESLKSISIDEYSFDVSKLPNSGLFRIPEEKNVGELTVSGLLPIEQEFKATVEREGLTGLKFETIWSEDGPRVPRKQRLRQSLGL